MDEVIEKEKRIENLIYEARGKQVMLDSDLGKIYRVETKRINEAVSRNKEKFSEKFSWILNKEEYYSIIRSQNATLKGGSIKGHTMLKFKVFILKYHCKYYDIETRTVVRKENKIRKGYVTC